MRLADIVVTGASEVRTCDPATGEGETGLIVRGAVAVAGAHVVWVGPESELRRQVETGPRTREIQAGGRAVVPGFVDAHTHLAFAGSRAEEFAARAGGRPYAVGGILETVAATRRAGTEDLVQLGRRRATLMLAHGTTTAEAKTGYALDLAGEMRLLDVLHDVHENHQIDLEITFLAAHTVPPEFEGRADDFVDAVCDWAPKASGRARFSDVFCDEDAFTPDQARRVLRAGVAAGLVPRIHAEELAPTGGALVASEVSAASADHLNHLDEDGARALARAGCVGVLCPLTALGLGRLPDVEMMRAQGMSIALATDLNPGTSYTENLQLAAAIATRSLGMGPEDALISITRVAAQSLRRPDIGRLAPGCLADIVILAGDSALDLGYHAGVNLAHQVLKRGREASRLSH